MTPLELPEVGWKLKENPISGFHLIRSSEELFINLPCCLVAGHPEQIKETCLKDA